MAEFRGSTKQCLKHYFLTLPLTNAKGGRRVLKPFVDFVGSSESTVFDWLQEYRFPKGVYLIKTRYFLESNGYQIVELEVLSKTARDFGRLVANDIFSFENAAKETGFKNIDYMSRTLIGYRKPKKDQEEKMKEIVDQYKDLTEERLKSYSFPLKVLPAAVQIEEKKLSETEKIERKQKKEKLIKKTILEELKTEILKSPQVAFPAIAEEINLERSAEKPDEFLKETKQASESDFAGGKNLLIESLAGLINVACPLAKSMLSDNFTADDRKCLRRLTRDTGVFELTNYLKKLCSEKARETIAASENNETKNCKS